MAFKFTSPEGAENPVAYQRTHPSSSNEYNGAHEDLPHKKESLGGTIGRNIGSSALKVGNGLYELFKFPAYVAQNLLPEEKRAAARERLNPTASELLGVNPEYLKPRNNIEKLAQGLGSNLPYFIPGNQAGLLTRLGIGTAGTLSELGAEKAGFSPGAQSAIKLGTELGTAYGLGIIPTLSREASKYWKQATGIGEKAGQLSASHVERGLNAIDELLTTQVNPEKVGLITKIRDNVAKLIGYPTAKQAATLNSIENALIHETDPKKIQNLNAVANKLTKSSSTLNPAKAMDLRKNIYDEIRALPTKDKELLQPAIDGVNNYFVFHSAEHPEFFDALTKSDQRTTLKHAQSFLAKGLNKLLPAQIKEFLEIGVGQAAKSAGLKGITLEAGKIGLGQLDKIIAKGQALLLNKPAAREHYWNLTKAIAQNSPQETINLINSAPPIVQTILGASLVNEQQQQEELPEEKGGFKFTYPS